MTRWPTALGEVCVILGGNAIPLGYVSPTEIRGQIPFGASAGILSIQSAGGKSESFNLPVLPAAPAIFHSGSAGPMTGIATVVRKKNNELVTASNPIHPEDELVIYLTGMGDVSPAIESGVAAPADPASGVVIAPQVALGSTNLDVQFAGTVAGKIGVYRIDVKVPFRVNQTGWEVPLTINQGGSTSQLLVRVIGN